MQRKQTDDVNVSTKVAWSEFDVLVTMTPSEVWRVLKVRIKTTNTTMPKGKGLKKR